MPYNNLSAEDFSYMPQAQAKYFLRTGFVVLEDNLDPEKRYFYKNTDPNTFCYGQPDLCEALQTIEMLDDRERAELQELIGIDQQLQSIGLAAVAFAPNDPLHIIFSPRNKSGSYFQCSIEAILQIKNESIEKLNEFKISNSLEFPLDLNETIEYL